MHRIIKRLIALALCAALAGFASASRADDGTAQAVMGLFGTVLNQMNQQLTGQSNPQPQSQSQNIQWADTKPRHKATPNADSTGTTDLKSLRAQADQGSVEAQSKLCAAYIKGVGMKKDYTEGEKWCRKAADQGNPEAEYNLGTLYLSGSGVAQSYTETANWFRKAADQGFPKAQFRLAELYHGGQRRAHGSIGSGQMGAQGGGARICRSPELPWPPLPPRHWRAAGQRGRVQMGAQGG